MFPFMHCGVSFTYFAAKNVFMYKHHIYFVAAI